MNLLINTYITPSTFISYNRGVLPADDKINVFKYQMASIADINRFSKIFINYFIDVQLQHRQVEVREYLNSLYQNKENVFINELCLNSQQDFIRFYNENLKDSDDNIWWCGNHDHIFVDSNLSMLDVGLEILAQEQQKYKNTTLYLSHHPELLANTQVFHGETIHPYFTKCNHGQNTDSIQILHKDTFYHWITANDQSHREMRRTDHPGVRLCDSIQDTHVIACHKELCRHYDAYSAHYQNITACMPLTIPPGFFENKIKIRYGYDNNLDDCVNINPLKQPKHYDINGTDEYWLLSELPLCWHKRISDIDIHPNIDWDSCIEARNTHKSRSLTDVFSVGVVDIGVHKVNHV